MSKVCLTYTFIFDPNKVFQRKSSFDEYLAKAFSVKGCVLERIEKPGEEESYETMVFIRPDETVSPQAPQDEKPQRKLKEMSKSRGHDGKYKKG